PQDTLQLMIPAAGGLLALAAALAAAVFVRIYGVGFLGRARTDAASAAVEVDRYSLTAMGVLAALCLVAGVMPGMVIDLISPVSQAVLGGQMPQQTHADWFRIVPIAEGRSSYSGMLVLVFISVSASCVAWAVHRFASHRMRRAPAWDCGFPDANPATQYSSGGFAQPLRRVLGTAILGAQEVVHMPVPGDPSPASLTVTVGDPVWQNVYSPIGTVVFYVATKMNGLQFLTIRRYLSLVFLLLIALLVGLMLWA
ncbi:MAG: hydrogenase 4 subunit B, partial [Paracoccaceae bacterium]